MGGAITDCVGNIAFNDIYKLQFESLWLSPPMNYTCRRYASSVGGDNHKPAMQKSNAFCIAGYLISPLTGCYVGSTNCVSPHNPVKYLYSSRESVKPNLRAMRWRFFLQYSGVILSKRAISFDDRLI